MDRFRRLDHFRNMDRKNLVMLILIVFFALILLILLFRLNSAWGQSEHRVLVSNQELSRGTRISADNLTWENYPPTRIKSNYYVQKNTAIKDVEGGVVLHSIKPNEPITRSNILPPSSATNYQALLKPNMRAVMLPIIDLGSGFVRSGDHVDIILTFNEEDLVRKGPSKFQTKKNPVDLVSKTLLTNVLILGVYPPNGGGPQNQVGKLLSAGRADQNAKWVTFELNPKQAEILTLANNMGVVSLSLQGNVIGHSIDEDSFTTSASIAGANNSEPKRVTIIRGSSKEVISLER